MSVAARSVGWGVTASELPRALSGWLEHVHLVSKHPVRVGCQRASPSFPFLVHSQEEKKIFRGLN